jgi:hypothetical protein
LFGAIGLVPMYQQIVQHESATNCGLLLLPMMGGMLVVSVVAGRAITRTGRYRWSPIVGGVVMTTGMFLLSRLEVDTSRIVAAGSMVVLGAGMGFLMQTTMLIAQNSVDVRDLGMASSAATFFRSIGGSFGVSLFGAVFANRMESDLTTQLGPAAAASMLGGGGSGARLDPKTIEALPAGLRAGITHAVAYGVATVFLIAVAFAVVVPVLAYFVREVPLRGRNDRAPGRAADGEVGEPALTA